jgi:hypothetical protein
MSTLRVNSIDNLSGTGGSANQVFYRNGSNVLSGSNNLTFDGTTLKNGGYAVLNNYSITYGVYGTSGSVNYVYPPTGKTISQLVGFIPSSRSIYFNGGVDYNDSLYCYYEVQTANNRIYVACYNSEQRGEGSFNFLAIWSA